MNLLRTWHHWSQARLYHPSATSRVELPKRRNQHGAGAIFSMHLRRIHRHRVTDGSMKRVLEISWGVLKLPDRRLLIICPDEAGARMDQLGETPGVRSANSAAQGAKQDAVMPVNAKHFKMQRDERVTFLRLKKKWSLPPVHTNCVVPQ